jgi:hypothetical protein
MNPEEILLSLEELKAEIQELRHILAEVYTNIRAPSKLAFSVKETVSATSISRSALYYDIAAGRLRPRKRGSNTIFLVDELRRYLESLPHHLPSPTGAV